MRHPALEALLARFAARVRAQLAGHRLEQYGIDPADVEQEVNIRLWRALERDPNAVLPASYIQKVVASALVDAVRRAKARPAEALPDEAEDGSAQLPDSSGVAPARWSAEARQLERVGAVMATLSLRRRQPLALYLQGFTIPEVAELVGLTFDAARKLVYRGLADVREQLHAMGEDGIDE